ncbi:MAG: transketolase family protein [Ignavibacteriae bacterium]|nr:transketolase family protein [Ignavibacteriota bacterium]MCB9215476.1 transketolase family protein [Ignavibacteria bacterium]
MTMNFEKYDSKPTRHGFGEGLVELGEKDERIVVLGGDITGSVMTSMFKDKFPDRFFSIGIAEQNATTIATGLALSGKVPFFASYGAFCALRNADQLRISVCYNEANVKIGGGHSGISVGPDGATHQILEDMAFLRALPHMTLVVPCDYVEARKATVAIGEFDGPAYIRFGRSATPVFTRPETPFVLGKAEVFRPGNDVAIIACGPMVWEALVAAEELSREGIEARVINLHTVKPLDVETVVTAARECGAVVTAEEHQILGGMGSAVAQAIVKNAPVPMEFVGVTDTFGGSGDPDHLMEVFGLTSEYIVKSVRKVVKRKAQESSSIQSITQVGELGEGPENYPKPGEKYPMEELQKAEANYPPEGVPEKSLEPVG